MFGLKWHTKEGTIMEIMAGMGRNFEVYNSLFSNFEMLDGCRALTRMIKYKEVKTHTIWL